MSVDGDLRESGENARACTDDRDRAIKRPARVSVDALLALYLLKQKRVEVKVPLDGPL